MTEDMAPPVCDVPSYGPTESNSPFHKLGPLELVFVREYIKTGNATYAMQVAKPDVRYATAKNLGCQWMKRMEIREAIAHEKSLLTESIEITKKQLIRDAARITGKAEKGKEYHAALKGVELQGKFIGAFDTDEDAADQYMKVLQKIAINADNVQINIGGGSTPTGITRKT